MAVLDLIPGITAHIIIEGDPAIELNDPDEIQVQHKDPEIAQHQASHTVSKYIESKTDERFSIKVYVGPPYKIDCSKLGFHIYVDGKLAWISTCPRPWFKNHGHQSWEGIVNGIKEGKGMSCTEKRFRFAKIETNSDQAELPTVRRIAQRLLKVGTIEIRVYRETYGLKGGPTEASSKGFLSQDGTEVPEKALKGDPKSHGTTLESPCKTARGDVWRTRKKDGKDWPIVIFRYFYRSQEALKQMYITPRTPSPTPSSSSSTSTSPSPEPEERDAEGFTAEQRHQIEAMKLNFERENAARASVGESAARRAKRIKREHNEDGESLYDRGGNSGARKRVWRGKKAELVDLTEEDEDDDELFVR